MEIAFQLVMEQTQHFMEVGERVDVLLAQLEDLEELHNPMVEMDFKAWLF